MLNLIGKRCASYKVGNSSCFNFFNKRRTITSHYYSTLLTTSKQNYSEKLPKTCFAFAKQYPYAQITCGLANDS